MAPKQAASSRVASQLSGWHRKSHLDREFHHQLDLLLRLLAEIRHQSQLEQAKALALRQQLIPILVKCCAHYGVEIGHASQAALMALNPIFIASLFLSPEFLYSAKPLALMHHDQAERQLHDYCQQLGTGEALLQWAQLRGGIYQQWMIVGYEAKLAGDTQARRIHLGDLQLSCPGYQHEEVRQLAKRDIASSVSSAFAALACEKYKKLGVKPTSMPSFDLAEQIQASNHQQLAHLFTASQTPAAFWDLATAQVMAPVAGSGAAV